MGYVPFGSEDFRDYHHEGFSLDCHNKHNRSPYQVRVPILACVLLVVRLQGKAIFMVKLGAATHISEDKLFL